MELIKQVMHNPADAPGIRSKDTASIVHSIHHHVRERTNQEQGNPFSSYDFCFYKLTLVTVPSHNYFLATKLVMSVRGLALLSRHDLWEGQEKGMVAASSMYQEHSQLKSTNTFTTHSSTHVLHFFGSQKSNVGHFQYLTFLCFVFLLSCCLWLRVKRYW